MCQWVPWVFYDCIVRVLWVFFGVYEYFSVLVKYECWCRYEQLSAMNCYELLWVSRVLYECFECVTTYRCFNVDMALNSRHYTYSNRDSCLQSTSENWPEMKWCGAKREISHSEDTLHFLSFAHCWRSNFGHFQNERSLSKASASTVRSKILSRIHASLENTALIGRWLWTAKYSDLHKNWTDFLVIILENIRT